MLAPALRSFSIALAQAGIDPTTLKISAPHDAFAMLQRLALNLANDQDLSHYDGETPFTVYDMAFERAPGAPESPPEQPSITRTVTTTVSGQDPAKASAARAAAKTS